MYFCFEFVLDKDASISKESLRRALKKCVDECELLVKADKFMVSFFKIFSLFLFFYLFLYFC